MKRTVDRIVTILIAVFFVGSLAFLLCKPQSALSEMERRALQERPKFSLESVWSGEYMKKFEAFASDQFYGRGFFVSTQAQTEKLLGKQENNGVYLAEDDYLIGRDVYKRQVPGIQTAMEALYGQGMKSLVFDLRGCPGGDLESVCGAADIFLDKGVIVYMEDKKGNRTYRYSDEEKDSIPMVILIDGNSASASEVFTGAMRDRERATIVGVTSFGKGIVQSLITLPDGSGISITTEQYFSPNGINIHGVGIEPDVKIELSEEAQKKTIPQLTLEEDAQLQAAIRVLNEGGR